MKFGKLLVIIGLFSCSLFAQSKEEQKYSSGGGQGAGIVIGEPNGISYRHWLSSANAVDAILGWSLIHDYVFLIADYSMHRKLFNIPGGNSLIYFGPGVSVGIGDGFGVGARFKVGLDYKIHNAPVDIFVELAPGIGVLPEVGGFNVGGGLGFRYFW